MLEFDHLDFHPTDFLEIREGLTDQDSYIATIFGNKTGEQLKEFYLIQIHFRSSLLLDKQNLSYVQK